MADYDANGNPIQLTKKYYDENGNPLDLTKSLAAQNAEKQFVQMGNSGTKKPDAPGWLRENAPNLFPLIGGIVGSELGPLGTVAGSGIGAGVKQFLFPQGNTPEDAITNMGIDTGINSIPFDKLLSVLPAIGKGNIMARGLLKLFPPSIDADTARILEKNSNLPLTYSQATGNESAASMENALARPKVQGIRQQQNALNMKDVKKVYKSQADILDLGAQKAQARFQGIQDIYDVLQQTQGQDAADEYYRSQITPEFRSLRNLTSSNTATYKGVAARALNDAKNAERFITATGDRETMEDLAFNKLVKMGEDPATGQFDSAKVLNELKQNDDLYKVAIRSQPRTNFIELMKRIEATKPTGTNPMLNTTLRWGEAGLALDIGKETLDAISGNPKGIFNAAKGLVLALPAKAIAKMMTNPQTARTALALTRTQAGTPTANFLTKSLINGAGRAGIDLFNPSEPSTP